MKSSIIIPAYNEEKRIGNTIKAYSEYFENLRNEGVMDYEILIVINGTTDNTEKIVRDYAKTNKRILCINLKKGGKGYAVIEGFKYALTRDSDLIGFVDSDMATSPESYYDLIKNIGSYDGVIADRYLPESVIDPRPSFKRILVSRIYNYLIRVLFMLPYRDTQCGAKIFKKKALSKIINQIGMTKWAFDLELIYLLRKNNFKIGAIPTVWSDREYSKINFVKSGPWMVLAIIRLRILNSPFNKFVKLYDKFIGFIPR